MGTYNKYPYTDFHELNLDWFLEQFKIYVDKTDSMEATVTEFTNFVTNYFEDLDAQQEIADKIREMSLNGELDGIFSPYIPDSVSEWLDDNITPTTPAIDRSLSVANAGADAAITGNSLKEQNSFDLLSTIAKTSGSRNGVTYTWDEAGLVLTTSGTPAGVTFNTIIYDALSNLPFNAGDLYTLNTRGLGEMYCIGYFYDGPDPEAATMIHTFTVRGNINDYIFKIPQNAVSMILRVWADSGMDCNHSAITVKILSAPSNSNIQKGTQLNYGDYGTTQLALIHTFDSANDVNINSTFFVSLVNNVTDMSDLPVNAAGWLKTDIVGYNNNALRLQIYVPITSPETLYFRTRLGGTWYSWQSITKSTYNAKMLSFGNSILTGSVWTNGVFNHLAPIDCAPYAMIGRSIGVGNNNIEHTLISSTGFLYDAGEGSFYDHLMAINDFSPYRAVLTHFWWMDLERNDWNTIVQAVTDLITHMRNHGGKNCYLIMVSPPPCLYDPVHAGTNAFNSPFAGGLSVKDLDERMLARFGPDVSGSYLNLIYLTWYMCPIAYTYQQQTDGNNVHLNNNTAYQILGATLAGQASRMIHF